MCLNMSKNIQWMSECSFNVRVVMLQKGGVYRKLVGIMILLFSVPARHWQIDSNFLWRTASIPVQTPSITHTHKHMHAHTHRYTFTQTCTVCGTRTDFMSKAYKLSIAYLMWRDCCGAFQFASYPCLYLSIPPPLPLLSLYFILYQNSFHNIYLMPSQQMTKLSDWVTTNSYCWLFVLHGWSIHYC